jgi:transcriptional regulator with XRE-family HTH domain
MANGSAVGDFLRWHREQLTPHDVGLSSDGRRRVPGLRREEVARRAGISTEYYIRLEQGREGRPSVAVLDALAEALRLGADQAAHLHELAGPKSRRDAAPRVADAPVGVVQLIEQMTLPAVLLNKYMDVLAANAGAQALFPNVQPGDNRIRALFLDRREREFWREWEKHVATSVAQLRADIGSEVDSSRVRALVSELTTRCPSFRDLWSRQDVRQQPLSPSRVRHPRLGDLELHREKLIVAGTDGVVLYTSYAHPGTLSAEKLAHLTDSLAVPSLWPAAQ